MSGNYEPLSEHICLVDTRNVDMVTDRLLGINIDKYFMPSVANVIGTDLSRYKLISKGVFACNPMHVGRDERLPVSLYMEDEPAIVSPAYFMFEIIDQSVLSPDYLMMWFRRAEFDRICWLKTDGSVRGGLSWDDLGRMELPVPSLDKQRAVVKAYQTITDRIALKRAINDNLEATATAYFHYLFDNTEGWELGCVSDLGEVVGGGTPSKDEPTFFCRDGIVWLTPKDLTSTGRKFITKGETDITEIGYKCSSTKLMPSGSVLLTSRAPVGVVAIARTDVCTNQGFKSIIPNGSIGTAFVYYFLKENRAMIESHASGTTFMEISGGILKSIAVFLPPVELTKRFTEYCERIFLAQEQIEQEISQLEALAELSVAKISAR
jgi:type I restriction enzyme S subunit